MENQPVVSEKQDFETATLLKKGKYGFYKQVDKIHSVYGDEPTVPKKASVSTEDKPPKETFSAFKPASETNHYLYPEKFNEFLQGFFTEKVKPFWSIGKEGFGGLEESAQTATEKIDGTTKALQDEGNLMLKRLTEIWEQIKDDVSIIGNEEATQSEKLKGFFQLLRDFLLLFYTLFSVFNVNTHPNLIDIIGETLTKMFVETDTGGLIDPEKSRIAIGYFTMIAYASVFIFIAYVASENFYYFLFYEFGENIMTEVTNEKGEKTGQQEEWSLAVWWSYYEKKHPNIFGLIHALFYMVTLIDTLLRRLRETTKGKSDDYSYILRISVFLAIYYLFNYMVTITGSPVFEIIFMIILILAVLRVCIFSYGSLGFAAASTSYAPSLFNIVITIIKIIVLFSINFALMPIGQLAVYAYIIFISFGIISFSETKRKNRGMIGRFFDTTREMRDYLLLNARIVANQGGYFSFFAHFIEKSWLSFSVIIVFLIMLFTLIPNLKDVQNLQMFAPILYFILIFWGISIVKIILNNAWEPGEIKVQTKIGSTTPTVGSTVPTPPTFGDLRNQKRNEIASSLSQGYKYVDGVPTFGPNTETQYKTGLGDAFKIGKETVLQKVSEGENLRKNDIGVSFRDNVSNPTSELGGLLKKAFKKAFIK